MATNNYSEEKVVTAYPKEIVSVKTQNQTFCVNAELSKMSSENGGEPLKLFSPYSRFIFAVISNGKSVIANIPFLQCAGIEQKSTYALNKHLDFSLESNASNNINSESNSNDNTNSNSDDNLSPAYKVRITSGIHKGKTPAEVLLEDENNKISLKNQYIFLNNNLSKYPKNKEQMDAIVDATNLLAAGKLKKDNVVSLKMVDLYDSGPRPLDSRKPDEHGNSFVYSINIKWLIGENNPVQITIENYYAPVVKKEDKTVIVKVSQKVNSTKNIMNLSLNDWAHTLKMMQYHQDICVNWFAKSCYSEAIEIDKKNRQKIS